MIGGPPPLAVPPTTAAAGAALRVERVDAFLHFVQIGADFRRPVGSRLGRVLPHLRRVLTREGKDGRVGVDGVGRQTVGGEAHSHHRAFHGHRPFCGVSIIVSLRGSSAYYLLVSLRAKSANLSKPIGVGPVATRAPPRVLAALAGNVTPSGQRGRLKPDGALAPASRLRAVL